VIFGLISNVQPTTCGLTSIIKVYPIEVRASREWVATFFISGAPVVFIPQFIKDFLSVFVIDSHPSVGSFFKVNNLPGAL
jgi:hypothetical protein